MYERVLVAIDHSEISKRALAAAAYNAVSYTHLTLPTILLV